MAVDERIAASALREFFHRKCLLVVHVDRDKK